ncbi:MAG: hypothetical protein V4506_19170, partial [Bacteroidota bacterium]
IKLQITQDFQPIDNEFAVLYWKLRVNYPVTSNQYHKDYENAIREIDSQIRFLKKLCEQQPI